VHVIMMLAATIMFAFIFAEVSRGSAVRAEAKVSYATPPRDRKH